MKNLCASPTVRSKRKHQSKANTPSVIKTIWIKLRNVMKTAGLNSFTPTAARLMCASHPFPSCPVVQFLFLQTDLSVHFTRALKMASFSCSAPCNFYRMISLRRRITKRFRRLFLDGCSTATTLISQGLSKKKPRSKTMLTYPTSQHWPIAFARACKSLTIYLKTSRPSSTTTFISLTLTSSQSQLSSSNSLELSMNPSNLFHLSLKLQCLNYKLRSFFPVLRTCLHQVSICTTLMNNSQVKSKFKLYLTLFFRIKMAQLTNKCNDDDLEYYIKECGDILGVSS